MTLSAKIGEAIYYSTKISHEFGQQNKAECIGCKSQLTFHRNICGKRISHWAHKTECSYETEPETQEHLQLKELIYNSLHPKYTKHFPDSVFIGDQKPDIFIEEGETKIAIEIQCSPLTYEKFIQRTKGYSDKGIYVFWVFGEKWNNFYYNEKENQLEKRVKEVEKKIHQLNQGRTYYVSVIWDEILGFYFTPTHYKTIIREKNYCENCWWEENVSGWNGDCSRCWIDQNGLSGGIVKNELKSIKELQWCDEEGLEKEIQFQLFQNEGLKLARLNDPDFWTK